MVASSTCEALVNIGSGRQFAPYEHFMTVGTRSFLDAAKSWQVGQGMVQMKKISERHPKRKQGGDCEHEQPAALVSKDVGCTAGYQSRNR